MATSSSAGSGAPMPEKMSSYISATRRGVSDEAGPLRVLADALEDQADALL